MVYAFARRTRGSRWSDGAREGVEGEQILFGLLEQLGHFRRRPGETCDHLADQLARLAAVVGVEDLAQCR